MSAAAALCALFYVLPPQVNYSRPLPHAQQKTRPLIAIKRWRPRYFTVLPFIPRYAAGVSGIV